MTAKNPSNADPISGAPGAHPAGVGVGAAGGAAAGAAIGSMAGPVGTVVGGAIGAVAGGLAGKGAAEGVNPTAEDTYWRDNYTKTPGYKADYTYDDYAPAYALGYNNARRFPSYDLAEPHMADEWDRVKGHSRLSWEQAKAASRAAWDKVERAMPGDLDRDGR